MGLSLMEGNEAVAWGALAAGCRFFAGYPITPATTILNAVLQILPPRGGVVVQGEDEIASMGYCLGASMAGLKVLTATSGPGISLYSEHISLAIGGEIPLVIVDVQRLGPTTGSATRGADGDVQFLRWGNSGGLPVIVLAPSDAAECYTLTAQAFNLAERFRCPVFLATNKEIGLTKESVDLASLEIPEPVERKTHAGGGFIPFAETEDGVPPFLPIGGETLVRQTSSTHGPDGYLTTDPVQISKNIERMRRKIEDRAEEIFLCQEDFEEGAETLILTYGVTSRAARAALRGLRRSGEKVSLLTLQTLWPVAEGRLRELTAGVKRILVVEMNTGQYVREISRVVPDKQIDFLGQMNGNLISPAQIAEAFAKEGGR